MKKIIALLLLFLVVYSCTKDKNAATTTKTTSQTTDIATLTDFLATSLQVNKNTVVFDKAKDIFVVQGDMRISKQSAENRYQNKNQDAKSAKVLQRYVGFVVGSGYITDVKVYSTVNTDWTSALASAITSWNNLNTLVHFRLVTTAADHDIVVDSDHLGTGSTDAIAQADLPPGEFGNGPVGDEITVNIDYTGTDKAAALIHELGHTVGLTHTDQSDGYQIPNTPTSESNSIMNHILSASDFSNEDIHAINILYPHPPIPIHVIGTNMICGTGTTQTYTTDKPADATMTWSTTGTAGSIPSPSTGYSVVLTATGNGDVTIGGTVTPSPYDYHTYFVVPVYAHIGLPTISWSINTNCDVTAIVTVTSLGSTIESITYRTDSGNVPMTQVGPNQYELPPSSSWVDITLSNDCGTSTFTRRFVRTVCP